MKALIRLDIASRGEQQDVGADLTHVATTEELIRGSKRKSDGDITNGTN